ncbi:class I SAM-dependent methyltransferase [Parafrankia sp. EUN1f]|uniref:class I SAM-dependent methyltransferase n=1 Tax=Parafrankia sp. EUN1f TaxID=102897 RepID=UPI001E65C2E6|nr:class I SAM-dependent methyltransferase [Parafrankia sp. EUN1f]
MNFDRMADRYDQTRGGEERGRRVAGALVPHLGGHPRGGTLLEIGVGTGLISAGFAGLGWSVAGVDVSERMLAHAARRLPGRVLRADATAIPFRAAVVDVCVAVHVIHLVGDPGAALAEVARVLRPGGRFAFVGGGKHGGSDVAEIVGAMQAELSGGAPRRDDPEAVTRLAERAGLRHAADLTIVDSGHPSTPLESARQIELRTWSHLWSIPAARWTSVVEPALDALRGLPNPTEPRSDRISTPSLVFEKPAAAG